MKGMKFSIGALRAAMLLSGCSMSTLPKAALLAAVAAAHWKRLSANSLVAVKELPLVLPSVQLWAPVLVSLLATKWIKRRKPLEAANAKAEIIEGNDGISYVKEPSLRESFCNRKICPHSSAKRLGDICQGVGQRHGSLHLRIHGQ